MPNLFPTDPSQMTAQTAQGAATTAFPRSWQFDFARGDFVTDQAGRVSSVDGAEAYRQWALKALMSQRYRHPVYGRQYGTELEALRRQNMAPGVLESEITRTITETLMVDPRTASVGDFVFERQGATLTVSLTVKTAQGDSVALTVPTGGNA